MGDEVARLYEDEDGDDDGDEDVGDEGFRPPLKRPLRLRHVRLHGLPYSGGEGSFLYEDESGALKPHYAFQDSPQAPRAAPLAQDIEASADREGIPLAFRATASAAVGNFFRSVDFRPLDEAAAAFQQKQHGGEDVKGGGDATASNVTGGGAEGASSTFIPDEEVQRVLEEYKEHASNLSKLNEKTTDPSLPCNTCALVHSNEKEGSEFVSLDDLIKLHKMGDVAVFSTVEVTYFAVHHLLPWAAFQDINAICPTFRQIRNRVEEVLKDGHAETEKKFTAFIVTDAVIAQAAPFASLDSSGTWAPPPDTPPPSPFLANSAPAFELLAQASSVGGSIRSRPRPSSTLTWRASSASPAWSRQRRSETCSFKHSRRSSDHS